INSRRVWMEMGIYTSRLVWLGLGIGVDAHFMEKGRSSTRGGRGSCRAAQYSSEEDYPKQVCLYLYPNPLPAGSCVLLFDVLGSQVPERGTRPFFCAGRRAVLDPFPRPGSF